MCDGLRTSKHLTKILSIVLKFGNRLNASSSEKGGAYGFRISILPELAVLKSINKGTNLLEYLVKFLETKFPETMTFFDEEISRIDVCCGIKFARLASRLKEFRSSVDRTRDLAQVISSCAPVPIIQVSRSNSTEGSSDECESMSAKVHWESKLKELLEESEHVVSSLQTQLDELMDSARNLIKRFGDSPNDMSCDELLLVFKNLRNAFRRAQAALREAEKVEEKIKRKSVRKLAPKKRKSDRSDSALKRRKISLASESFHKIEPASASRALPAQVDLIEKPEPVPAKPVPAKGGLKSVLAAKRAFIADSDSDNEPLIRAPKKQRIEGAQYQLPEERPRMPVQLVHQIKRGA